MSIPQSQLEAWSHQGSVAQSKNTYAMIKGALEASNAKYNGCNYSVFLQGSYGNDTNIYSESDVDIVICYDGEFFCDLESLPLEQKSAFQSHFSGGNYSYSDFKSHVLEALRSAFGSAVVPSKKAYKITGNGSRRDADVVVAFEYKKYFEFQDSNNQDFSTGICFFNADNTRIVNYPKLHSKNLTTKHQETNGNLKPAIRIFKNMRSKLVENGLIAKDIAPSYYIEGLLYNVPDDKFFGNYEKVVGNILVWLYQKPDRTNFLCANEKYYLLRDNNPVCWPCANGDQFINATISLWNNWR